MRVVEVDAEQLLARLSQTFGYTSFRPLQQDIVQSTLDGRDVFVLLPTGGGKSLCYQLPALLLDGMTVVVSPLIALMKDQVDGLVALGVNATFINSSLDAAEINSRQSAVTRGDISLLYVAPERLMMPGFLRLLQASRISSIAIDEAHCISEWGHDFRPEYRQLRQLRDLFPDVPVGAFTATATSRVQDDIKSQLGLREAASFHGSFNRANLFYEVRPKKGAYEQVLAYARQHPQASGIIYCASRATTEQVAARLCRDGVRAGAYHAGLDASERRSRQEAFIRDDVRVMTATIAFGMGIDKPDVRFVMHYDLPKTLENYYQESGRAGRDGDPADCVLFFSAGDAMKIRRFIDEKPSKSERQIALGQLNRMTQWAEGGGCRRRDLLAYFGEDLAEEIDPCCDVCRTPAEEMDGTVAAQMLLSCVKRTGERFGTAHVIGVLRGARDERLLRLGHDKLSTYGIGRDRSDVEWKTLARELVQQGYLVQDAERYNALAVTELGDDVLFHGRQVTIRVREHATSRVVGEQPHAALFERLRVLRKQLAGEQGIPPYMVFSDATLRAAASRLPKNRTELRQLPGIGERKAADFGESLLDAVARYVEDTGAEPQPEEAAASAPRSRKQSASDSVLATVEMFLQGMDVPAIAAARKLAPATVEEHLAEAVETGRLTDIHRLVSPESLRSIQGAIAAVGDERLKPIMEFLGDGFTYGQLRVARAYLRRNGEHEG